MASQVRPPAEPSSNGHRSVTAIIVGAGFAGIGMARTFLAAGIRDVVVLERASSVGGTWRDNVYPGVACDVPTPLYSYSFAPKADWSNLFAPQRELRAYLEECTDRFGVRPLIEFDTEVIAATWDEASAGWLVDTIESGAAGEMVRRSYRCRVLVSASGHALSKPVYPDLPGRGRFAGTAMHSARWDASVPLAGRRVGVVGTGASAVQIVPAIAPEVGHLTVFQRTPAWVVPRLDRPWGPETHAFFRDHPRALTALRGLIYTVLELIATGHVVEPRLHALLTERLAAWHLERQVPDVLLRARLLPNFRFGCKRMLVSNDYLPALGRPNVSLVTSGIREVDATGVVTRDGRHHPLDVVIYATGYEAADAAPPFRVTGRGGRRLDDAWTDGLEAYLGTAITGFPNLFLLVGPNTGQGHTSMVYMMESQFPYILGATRALLDGRARALDVRPEAQANYNRWLQKRLKRTVWNTGGCKSWYLSRTGKNTTAWPGYTFEFRARLRRFDLARYQ
jgi:cation diffusion facilitator CzcD-associated flavoprotein CzcO